MNDLCRAGRAAIVRGAGEEDRAEPRQEAANLMRDGPGVAVRVYFRRRLLPVGPVSEYEYISIDEAP